ncbi:MAG: hypothetical protein NTV08_06870 [Verrucomicrobia bacterium]|nr:hypothetical protein [Verrucomicrobiota bacterium]
MKTTVIFLLIASSFALSACKPHGPVKMSNPEAARKYDQAEALLATKATNPAVDVAVDIVLHYPDSYEAGRAAILLMDKCDYIGMQQFYTLTGYRLPVDYELPRSQQIDLLMAAFQKRRIFPNQQK